MTSRKPTETPKVIETDILTATFHSDTVVTVRGKPHVHIDREKSAHSNQLIQDLMPGNYGMIIDREEDYSITPVEVFEILNNIEKLKAIAIVVHRNSSAKATNIDKLFSKIPLEVFFSVAEAKNWLDQMPILQQK